MKPALGMSTIKMVLSESNLARLLREPSRRRSQKFAKHYVAHASPELEAEPTFAELNPRVYQIWLQGVENAPPLARFCSQSVEKNLLNSQLVRLDLEGALELVAVPPKILSRWRSGQIGNAGLTDLLRFGLISKHGGTWADFSIFISQPVELGHLPDLLVYSDFDWGEESRAWFCANYFMKGRQGDPLFSLAFKSLTLQWQERGQVDYFDSFFHLAEAAKFLGRGTLQTRRTLSPDDAQALMAMLNSGKSDKAQMALNSLSLQVITQDSAQSTGLNELVRVLLQQRGWCRSF